MVDRPTVFVVQEPWPDRQTGESRRDFTPAERHGRLKFLLPHDYTIGKDIAAVLLNNGLAAWRPMDFLLCAGHPVAIGVATALAVARGPINLLVWSGRRRNYAIVKVDLFEELKARRAAAPAL